MKRTLPFFIPLLTLTGCHAVGDKSAGLSAVYIATCVFSLLLLGVYALTVRRKDFWMLVLFSAVPVVNIGYHWLSVCRTLDCALWANRLSYLGSVFLPLSMLMIILNVTNIRYKRWIPWALFSLALAIFAVAASPGFSDIYYREVSLEIVNGVSMLDKVYGVLHPLYMVYLLGYFAAMVGVILCAAVKKTVPSTAHALIVAFAVLVNIGVWLIGQLTHIEFEFLSVSYIISELFLLGLQYLVQDAARREEPAPTSAPIPHEEPPAPSDEDGLVRFWQGVEELTKTERHVFELYLDGNSTKDVMAALSITENTLKYHNKNIYSKLGVSSRKQLLQLAKQPKP